MAGWFSLDPNKLKQIAASTLINAQKQIDKVLDIKDGAPDPESQPLAHNTATSSIQSTTSDDFFSAFLGNQKSTAIEANEIPTKPTENGASLRTWNTYSDSNNASSLISSPSQTNTAETDANITDENKTTPDESIETQTTSSTLSESIDTQQQTQSSVSLAESSTITESSSSESTNSLRPTLSIPSSESTVIGPIVEIKADEQHMFTQAQCDSSEPDADHVSQIIPSISSDKRDVIDSWMNNRQNVSSDNGEQSVRDTHDNDSSSLLFTSAYPPNEFSTSSIIDDDVTPTANNNYNKEQQQQTTVSTDEDDDNPLLEQSNSPTHTISSNGHDTASHTLIHYQIILSFLFLFQHSKDSSDDGKHTSCASSDIEVISSPSVASGLALSTTETFDKCRELRDARRPVVREVVGRFPTHSTNMKYHHHPISIDHIDKNSTSNFDASSWSTLIDEAATEHMHYHNSNERGDDDDRQKYHQSETSKELGELKERLELREQAFLKLTTESNELHQTNQTLKKSLSELEQRTVRLTNEFQQTIENLSLKIEEQKHVSQERDQLRKQLDTLQRQLLENSTSTGNAMAVLREKEEQIQQLLEEGEKLSKNQLKDSNIIKKLRAKEKESDTHITSLTTQINKLTSDLEEAKKNLQEKEENEKQLKETVKKLEKSAVHYEKECISIKSLYEDAEEQIRSTKVALENSYKEIAELNKTKAATESKVVEATLSAEILLREEIRMAVDKERVISRQEQEKLQMTIDELRHSIQRSEAQLNRREQLLRQEVNDLRQRLQEAESRNEELTQSISNATRPLLRQIENLQTSYVSQINSLEKTERQLTDRLAEMQMQYATSIEHERVANENLLEMSAKWKLAEAQLTTFKQDKTRLTSELEVLKLKLTHFEDAKFRERTQIESMQEAFTQQINSLIQEKRQLELDTEVDKSKYENDLKRLQIANEALKEQVNLHDSNSIHRTNSNLETTLAQQHSRRSSGGRDTPTVFAFERSAFVPTPKPSVYESLRNTGAIAVLESLEAQLKEKEGEITLLQSEIADLERTRETMARELVNLSTENEKLRQQTQNYPVLNEQYKELEKRYDALLTMYGEKQEEADELRLDLADVKTLYRAQIDDLMKQNASHMSLPSSYSCRSAILSSIEKLFSPNPQLPYPSHVYIHGNHNTASNYDTNGHLLYLLFKLNELTLGYFHHSLILIGHQPFYQLPHMNQIEAELGVLTPIAIFVPAYTRAEIVTILQNMFAQQQGLLPTSVSQIQIIIELALQIFYAVTNDLIELKDMSTMCIKDFLRNSVKKQTSDDGSNNDYRILYQKEFFTQVLNSVYTRSMSIPKFLDTHTADEETNENSSHLTSMDSKSNARDLPTSAKYLLIAIYLATQNPVKYDRMLYDKQGQGKKSRRGKIMHKRAQLDTAKIEYLPLSSNKPIGLNRLLAIYCSLQGDTVPLTNQIYIQLALLTSMRLIELVGGSNESGIINLNEPKYRCTSSSDCIRRLAASIDFKIDDLLLV
ncbi:unnamed protein product [Adineta ricciae]|uniref:Uncharacterized protein n=2 Tax=Adineta ricciae TaxID=249248 RepID=A0A814HHB9_ADIRI|nr:unnamed protein product [Adineta ricciae]